MTDRVEQLGDSLIQHGKYNDRIYLMKLGREDRDRMPGRLMRLARREGYSKVFAKVPASAREAFQDAGYVTEARVRGFFLGREDGLFMSRFLAAWREDDPAAERADEVLRAARQRHGEGPGDPVAVGYRHRVCRARDAEAVAGLYRRVFETYPFPIMDPAYIRKTMDGPMRYFGIWQGGNLAALASVEYDREASHVEMTDFATLPEHRGKGLGVQLLARMGRHMRRERIATAYTIARAASFGMNITFARLGYEFGGRLVRNTNIAGELESMNIWYLPLHTPQPAGSDSGATMASAS